MVYMDGIPSMPRRSPEELERRRERQRENHRRNRVTESTRRCLECKHFFFGKVSGNHAQSPIHPWKKHRTLKGWVWDDMGTPSNESWQGGYCRFNPEPIVKRMGDTCGQWEEEQYKIYQMISEYGECVHDLLHEVYPERDWYQTEFPSQDEIQIQEPSPNVDIDDGEMFEIE